MRDTPNEICPEEINKFCLLNTVPKDTEFQSKDKLSFVDAASVLERKQKEVMDKLKHNRRPMIVALIRYNIGNYISDTINENITKYMNEVKEKMLTDIVDKIKKERNTN